MIPHNRPTLGRAEQEAAARVLAGGWVAQGPEVEALESEVCEYLGLPAGHAVALSSGSAALFVALWVLNAKGKRVAVPVYSCAALRNAVVMAGAQPVMIDVAQESPNIDLEAAARRAEIVIAAHMFGVPVRWSSQNYPVPIIEDCAQAFGARSDGHPVGTRGNIGVFSFYATKMLTSGGQGGMLVSSDLTLVDAARDYRQFDCRHDRAPRFNLQMTDLQAAIGRAQLGQLDGFLRKRRALYSQYAAAGIELWPAALSPDAVPSCYRAIIRTANPAAMISGLEKDAIRAIVPIAEWELLDEAEGFPRAAELARSTVSIPMYPSLTPQEIAAVIKAVSVLNPAAAID